jgi:hypothetical protein
MAIGTAALIGGALSIGSAVLGASAAKKAARTQSDAARYAADLGDRQYQQTREDFAPWREAGGDAIADAYAMTQPGYDHTTSPGYDFRLNEGLRAVENSAAARGLLGSGGTLKGINREAQGHAALDYNDQFKRLSSIAQGGQSANQTLGALGASNAQAGGEFATQGANARASGYVGQANAWQQGLGSLASLFGGK